MDDRPINIDMEDEGIGSMIVSKARRSPFLAVGVLAFLTTLGIGAYRFKNRPRDRPMSLYLLQLRVAAQSAIIGTLTVGLVYNMLNDYVFKDKTRPPKSLKN